jgi:hypothetical protein
MNFSSLSASDRRLVITAAIAALMALLSFFDPTGDWGTTVGISLIAALAVIAVVLWPQLSPNSALPVPRGLALLVLAAVTAGGFVIAALVYLSYVFSINLFSILFDIGVLASLALLYFAWLEYQATPKAVAPATPTSASASPPPSAPPPPPPSAEPPGPPQAGGYGS